LICQPLTGPDRARSSRSAHLPSRPLPGAWPTIGVIMRVPRSLRRESHPRAGTASGASRSPSRRHNSQGCEAADDCRRWPRCAWWVAMARSRAEPTAVWRSSRRQTPRWLGLQSDDQSASAAEACRGSPWRRHRDPTAALERQGRSGAALKWASPAIVLVLPASRIRRVGHCCSASMPHRHDVVLQRFDAAAASRVESMPASEAGPGGVYGYSVAVGRKGSGERCCVTAAGRIAAA
jgi:hypothetical protein